MVHFNAYDLHFNIFTKKFLKKKLTNKEEGKETVLNNNKKKPLHRPNFSKILKAQLLFIKIVIDQEKYLI